MRGLAVTIQTTATQILPEGTTGTGASGDIGYPTSGVIRNPSSGVTVYLGGPGVNTTTAGFPLAAGEDIEIDIVGDVLYGIVASNTSTIYVLRRGG